jgi:Protein of unknown function (DUF3572)
MPLRAKKNIPDPETLALLSLARIASDESLFARFFALSGLDQASLRARAAEPAVLGGVLDFVLGDERLVTALAQAFDVPPEAFARARRKLPGAMVED